LEKVFPDVICNDCTRVILNDGKGSDYIHANYIKGDPLLCTYICTQGPLPSTIFDFWRMIWLEKVSHVIMLCSTMECGKKKCEQYWPEDNGASLTFNGNNLVNNSDPHVTRTTLELKQGTEKHFLKHHRWKTWPDKTVPKSLLAVFRILHQTRKSKTPIVVHCSAGVGRTGSFVSEIFSIKSVSQVLAKSDDSSPSFSFCSSSFVLLGSRVCFSDG
uniref:Protein-tyrosine phosphatase n=1 Tax=Haemonchus placei TaxID=6290 RepID=A0A0N4WEA3_HAEPC